jgi:hypothetical protein
MTHNATTEVIHVTKRSSAIIQESYSLEIDSNKYKEYMAKNPNATAEDVARDLEPVNKIDYEVFIDKITQTHETECEFN